jgi:ATP-dependent Clp protease ATP-binding subunit ClpA
VDFYQVFTAGLSPQEHPVGNFLFLGPTGVGKTKVCEAICEILFGTSKALLKVNCAEFQHSHEIAKLIGSPPGYLGHRETHPYITTEALTKYHTDKLKISFLLFDEIEKASDALWQLLLAMLDKATLTLGDNRCVDLSQTMIFLTSNLGGKQITELMTAGALGFNSCSELNLDKKIGKTAEQQAKKKFSPEFMNRIDKVVVFQTLQKEHLERILTIELAQIQQRVMNAEHGKFYIQVNKPARAFLLKEGTDLQYGARYLKRAIERYLVYPLANLLSSGQLELGDSVHVNHADDDKQLTFVKGKAITVGV